MKEITTTADKIAALAEQLKNGTQEYLDAVAQDEAHKVGELRVHITRMQDELERLKLQLIKERNG